MKDKKVIKNGLIVDGTGAAPYPGDILLMDGRIVDIIKTGNKTGNNNGSSTGSSAGDNICSNTGGYDILVDAGEAQVTDAAGRLVTPGFIDIHRHLDYAVIKEGFGEVELAQGIATAVSGSCGLTPFPLRRESGEQLANLLSPCLGAGVRPELFTHYRDYAAYLKAASLPLNIGNLIGSCSVRIAVKGFAKTGFTIRELDEACGLVDEAMEAGALGLSMGLMYLPEYYSTKEELVAMAKVAARHGGVLTCHIRGEGDSLVSSVAEIIGIARAAEISLQISHFKSCGARNWQREIYKAIALIERERGQGMDIHVDFYPYTGGATTLLSLIPPAFQHSSPDGMWAHMVRPGAPAELEQSLAQEHPGWDNYLESLGLERILITQTLLAENQQYIGKTLADIRQNGRNPYEFICSLLASEQGKVGIIVMSMSQADVDTVARLPYSFVISDALYGESGTAHPRLYAAFSKILRDFVLERKVLSLPEAIRKMTAMPAEKLRLKDRGLIREGYVGDLNIFDLCQIEDCSDFRQSGRLSRGMGQVLIGGKTVWKDEQLSLGGQGSFIERVR